MSGSIRIHEYGGPEVLRWESVEVGQPADDEVVIRQTAIGLNFIDTYHRTGLYPLPELPATLGREAVGVVEAVGADARLSVGDRVGYVLLPGSYTERRRVKADALVPIPDAISDESAAATLLKGLTAWFLVRRAYPVKAGDRILVHAAAGGVGLLLCQWARHLGAQVIGTVGSEAKAELARAHGCEATILYREENFVERVHALTDGAKLPVVYDSVGADTFEGSLDCLQRRGLLVMFGQSSGAVPPFSIGKLASKGSLFLTRPTLGDYIATPDERRLAASELFDRLADGTLRANVGQRYPLREAEQAHRDLESRRTSGATLLVP